MASSDGSADCIPQVLEALPFERDNSGVAFLRKLVELKEAMPFDSGCQGPCSICGADVPALFDLVPLAEIGSDEDTLVCASCYGLAVLAEALTPEARSAFVRLAPDGTERPGSLPAVGRFK